MGDDVGQLIEGQGNVIQSFIICKKTLFKKTFWLHLLACAILVPGPGIEPAPAELDGRV